ncbi:MAG: prenyltransferase/squalene oxidase repeat-containing protein [Planctomycetota bacterium]|nr:prenyltransferase/squalene oxidase repeat-containing protein [Planctomycetota bacterium]
MSRFLRSLFEKELAWIRSLLPSRSRRKKISPTPADASPPGPPAAPTDAAIYRQKSPSRSLKKRRGRAPSARTTRPAKRTRQKPLISPHRAAPLKREIARSPADPFASVVAAVVLHATLLLMVYPILFPIAEDPPPPKTFVIRWEVTEKKVTKAEPPAKLPDPLPEPQPTPETEEKPIEVDPALEEIATDPVEDNEPVVAGVATGNGSSGNHRVGESRSRALQSHGGNTSTEDSVLAGVQWLIRHQDQDGSWSPDRFDRHCEDRDNPCSGHGYSEHRAGITALALLALLGNGHLPNRSGDAASMACDRAIQWLLNHKDPDGCIRTDITKGARNLYDHGIATFALCEAAQLTDDPALIEQARSAVRFLESSQQPGGGWDYTPSPSLRNDLSITGWQALALHAAIEAGILPNPTTIQSIDRYLNRAIDETGHAVYSDRGRGRGRTGYGIDAVGLITRLALGHSPISEESLACAQRIANSPPRPDLRKDWDLHPQSMYYWYTATLALFHVGGAPWRKWNQQLQLQLLPLQVQEGESMGSWNPDPNWIGAAGGRVAQTALGVLTFETYFRYIPMYQKLGIARNPRDR